MKSNKYKIFIADDDLAVRETVSEVLMDEGYLISAYDPADPDDSLLHEHYDIAILDMVMPHTDGFALRTELLKHSPSAQFIFITGFPDSEKLERAMDLNVFNFLTKPFTADHIRYTVLGALRTKKLLRKNFEQNILLGSDEMGLIGKSDAITSIKRRILEVSPLELPVLITGESGTGKEVVARCIHRCSLRAGKQFTVVNCAGLSPGLIESELFGHAQGAFTGAIKIKHGFFEISDGGTIFLDEIGDLPLELQSKFLRILDTGEFNRVGDTATQKIDVRILSATNRDIDDMARQKQFREDFYYRIRGAHLHLPPLRDRREDIPLLAGYFLRDANVAISPDAVALLQNADWPGNVRELRMIISNCKGKDTNRIITKETVARVLKRNNRYPFVDEIIPYKKFKSNVLGEAEKHYFDSLLAMTHNNISKAASLAGMHRKNFYDKLKQYELIK